MGEEYRLIRDRHYGFDVAAEIYDRPRFDPEKLEKAMDTILPPQYRITDSRHEVVYWAGMKEIRIPDARFMLVMFAGALHDASELSVEDMRRIDAWLQDELIALSEEFHHTVESSIFSMLVEPTPAMIASLDEIL